MGIVVQDEADKKSASVRKEREKVLEKNQTDPQAEMNARELDRTSIRNPDKNYRYYLANRTSHDGVRPQVLEGMGWETVPDDATERLAYGVKKDGGQVHGDLVLMRTKVANYEAIRKRKDDRYRTLLGEMREEQRERLNKIARDSGVVGPHRDATFDESGEF